MYTRFKDICAVVVASPYFIWGITAIIILNSVLIAVEIDAPNKPVEIIQKIILIIFTVEIFIRWFGKDNVKEYITNGWNWFDVTIVLITFIPEGVISQPELLTALRILRVFRVFRLIKIFPELQTITLVLFKSITSLFFVSMLMLIVLYIYAIIGVILFEDRTTVANHHGQNLDPFGTVPEAMFSLFRVLTGEDWTDLRYDLLHGRSGYPDWLVTGYFISWFIISGYLLINIVVGAVVNNYDKVMQTDKDKAEQEALEEEHNYLDQHFNELKDEIKKLNTKIDELEKKQ